MISGLKHRHLFKFFVLAILPGCSSIPTHFALKFLDSDISDQISSTKVICVVPNKINSTRLTSLRSFRRYSYNKSLNNGNNLPGSFDDIASEIDFSAEFSNAIIDQYQNKGPLFVNRVVITKPPFNDVITANEIQESSVLIIRPTIYLTSFMRAIKIDTKVELYLTADLPSNRRNKMPRPVYTRNVQFQSSVAPRGQDNTLSFWLDEGGDRLISNLLDGIKETIKLVGLDIGMVTAPDIAPKRSSWKLVDPEGRRKPKVYGQLIEKNLRHSVVQLDNGILMSVPPEAGPYDVLN